MLPPQGYRYIDGWLAMPSLIVPCSVQCVQLKKENEVLRRNASILYNTAKTELARRDTELNELRNTMWALQKELEQVRKGGGAVGYGGR
jgi:hypothetical protein